MKTYRGMEIQPHKTLTSALQGDERWSSCISCFRLGKTDPKATGKDIW